MLPCLYRKRACFFVVADAIGPTDGYSCGDTAKPFFFFFSFALFVRFLGGGGRLLVWRFYLVSLMVFFGVPFAVVAVVAVVVVVVVVVAVAVVVDDDVLVLDDLVLVVLRACVLVRTCFLISTLYTWVSQDVEHNKSTEAFKKQLNEVQLELLNNRQHMINTEAQVYLELFEL